MEYPHTSSITITNTTFMWLEVHMKTDLGAQQINGENMRHGQLILAGRLPKRKLKTNWCAGVKGLHPVKELGRR